MNTDTLLFFGFIAGFFYILYTFAKYLSQRNVDRISDKQNKPSLRLLNGGMLGLIAGIIFGYFGNPLSVSWNSPGDVAGLTIFSWLLLGFVGLIIGSFVGLLLPKRRSEKRSE